MDKVEATYRPIKVLLNVTMHDVPYILLIARRVLNVMKTMINEDEVMEKDDMHIRDRMREFLTSPDVSQAPAAKLILANLDRKVRARPNEK